MLTSSSQIVTTFNSIGTALSQAARRAIIARRHRQHKKKPGRNGRAF